MSCMYIVEKQGVLDVIFATIEHSSKHLTKLAFVNNILHQKETSAFKYKIAYVGNFECAYILQKRQIVYETYMYMYIGVVFYCERREVPHICHPVGAG